MKKSALILILALAAGACQTLSLDYRQGVQAEMNQNYEEAVRLIPEGGPRTPQRVRLPPGPRPGPALGQPLLPPERPDPRRPEQEERGRGQLQEGPRSSIPRTSRPPSELQALIAPPEKPAKNGEKLEGPVRLKGSGEALDLSFRNEVSLRSIFQTLGPRRRRQLPLRRHLPGHQPGHRPDRQGPPAGRQLPLRGQQELLPRHRRADRHHRPRQRPEADAVRAQRHQDLLPVQHRRERRPDAPDPDGQDDVQGPVHPGRQEPQLGHHPRHAAGRGPGREAPPRLGQGQGRGPHRHRDHGGQPAPGEEPRHRPQHRDPGPPVQSRGRLDTRTAISRSRGSTSATWPTTR